MAAADKTPAAPPTAPPAAPAAKAKRYLVTANCYRDELGGFHKRGSYVTIPAGSKAVPSQTWTEVDDNGRPVVGGQVAKPIAKFVESKKALAAGGVGADPMERLTSALEKLVGSKG
jgi:hypothetical protein